MMKHDISSLREEVDEHLSRESIDIEALGELHSRVSAGCQPMEAEIDKLKVAAEKEGLTDFARKLHATRIKRIEAELAPLKMQQARIEEYVDDLYHQADAEAELAELAARYSSRRKVEGEMPKLVEETRKLARQILHGLSPDATWPTRQKYTTVQHLLAQLKQDSDHEAAVETAATIVAKVKPRLSAKVAAFADLHTELLSALVDELKK
ncbi:MAG: hypothetical protein IH600_05735 [Bacteroidetes bacterium]|nr:hypothetical protein [Bacteroidota bacterium]